MKVKNKNVKQVNILKTPYGKLLVINADLSKGHFQGYEVGKVANFLTNEKEVEIFDDCLSK